MADSKSKKKPGRGNSVSKDHTKGPIEIEFDFNRPDEDPTGAAKTSATPQKGTKSPIKPIRFRLHE